MTNAPSQPKTGSLWSETAIPPPECAQLDHEVVADVAIVGGGFTGLSAALHLAERAVSVALVEAGQIGEGGSGRNGGQVIPGFKRRKAGIAEIFGHGWADRICRLGDGAADRVFDLIAKHGIQCSLERTGWLRGAHSDIALRDLDSLADELRNRGAQVELLSHDAVASKLGTAFYRGGMLDRRAGALQPLNYARGLARAAQGLGARIFVHSPAAGVVADGKKWRVTAGRGSILAEQLIVATGAYTDRLWPGLARSFVAVQSAQLASAPLTANLLAAVIPSRVTVSDTRKLSNYYRVDADGRFLIGGRAAPAEEPTPSTLQAIMRAARNCFPALADVRWEFAWCGSIDMTTDEMPRFNRLAPGVWSVLGYNGRGVAMATTMGAVLANKIAGGKNDELDFPETPLAQIPFHELRAPAVAAVMAWYRIRDAMGLAG